MNAQFTGKAIGIDARVEGYLVVEVMTNRHYIYTGRAPYKGTNVFEVDPASVRCVQVEELCKKWEERAKILIGNDIQNGETKNKLMMGISQGTEKCITELREIFVCPPNNSKN